MNRQGVARMHRGRRQRLRGIGLAAASLLVGAALVAQTGVTTDATWNDTEWAHNTVGTVDCTNPAGAFATRGEGRVLSGSLLGFDLDTIAEAKGVEVTNNGERAIVDPDGAIPSPADPAYADPLHVESLSTVDVNLGKGILKLPLNNDTGVLGQFAEAESTGTSRSAAGYVTETGGIGLDPGTGYPELATLSLSDLLSTINPTVANALTDIADVSLVAGAVAGRSALDACAIAWGSDVSSHLVREYLAASLDLDIDSPTVGALVTAASGSVSQLQTAVNGLTSNTGLTSAIATGVTGLLNAVLSGPDGSSLLRLGQVEVSVLSASIDLSSVQTLLTSPFGDDGGVLTVHPGDGLIRVSTAALLEAAYPGAYSSGLNGLPPNTNLLQDPAVLTALNTAIGNALSGWVADVNAALYTAIDAVVIDVSISIDLKVEVVLVLLPVWVEIGSIEASVSGRLSEPTVSADLVLLPGLLPVVTTLLNGLLKPVLDLLLSELLAGLPAIVFGAVNDVLGTFRTLPTSVRTLTTPIVNAVSLVYNTLFLNGVVTVVVNAQNDPLSGSTEPLDWTGLPQGRYDVAAFRIGVLGALAANDVRLYLGRGSVGVNCSVAHAAVPGSPCANY